MTRPSSSDTTAGGSGMYENEHAGDEALAPYEGWDLTETDIPRRSRLFSVAPIGVGTAGVESLTGYVARLAEAHAVTTSTLVSALFVPRLGRRDLQMHPSLAMAERTLDERNVRPLEANGCGCRDGDGAR